jgi:Cu/Ag efflux protein CusF
MRRSLGYGLLIVLLSGCQNQSPPKAPEPGSVSAAPQAPAGPPKEFKLEGDIVSVDKEKKSATIKHGPIEGYMSAMTMSYPIPDPADLDKIKAGDHITATVYDDRAQSKYWVGNIKVGEPAPK